MTFDPSNVLFLGQGFFRPILVAIGHSWAIWHLVDLGWPLHDFRLQQCITLQSVALPTKFGFHRSFLSNLTPGWPRLTSAWPLIPPMYYSLVSGSSYQIWWPYGISNLTSGWPLNFGRVASKIRSQTSWVLTPMPSFSSIPKHDKMHGRTYIHTYRRHIVGVSGWMHTVGVYFMRTKWHCGSIFVCL